jgi:hypothetical protein
MRKVRFERNLRNGASPLMEMPSFFISKRDMVGHDLHRDPKAHANVMM